MKTKNLLAIIFLLSFALISYAQDDDAKPGKIKKKKESAYQAKKAWSIGLYGSEPIIFGDVNIDPLTYGFGLNIQKALGHSLSLRLQGGMGHAKGVDRKFASTNMKDKNPALNGSMDPAVDFKTSGNPAIFNYRMDYKELALQLVYNFNFHSDYRLRQNPRFDMYALIGGGGLLFKTFTDQLDNGKIRDYSTIYNDYTAGNIDQSETKKRAMELLDGDYETATEGNPDGSKKTYETIVMDHVFVGTVNVGLGMRFKLSDRIDLGIESRALLANNDLLDGQRWSKVDAGTSPYNDIMFHNSLGLNIRLGRLDNIYWFDNPSAQHYKITLENRRKVALLSSDVDNDGVSDYFDKDLETPEGVKVDVTGKAIDSDNDGIPDYKDVEPFSDKEAVVDTTGMAIDTDKDGVPDHKDLDDETPEGMLVNFQGVPIGKRGSASGVAGSSLGFLPAIFFDFDDATLKTESLSSLSNIASALKYNPETRLRIVGYTDNIGSPEYNKQLGQRRAKNVADFLIMQGVDPSRLEIESRGEAEPLTDVKTSDANRLNRRVQFQVIEGGGFIEEPEEEGGMDDGSQDDFQDVDGDFE